MKPDPHRTERWRTARLILRRPSAKVGLGLVSFVFILAVYGATVDPYAVRAFPCLGSCSGIPPFVNLAHPFGTYPTGQDVLSEIAHGSPVDLTIGFGATAVAVLIGTVVGMLAGYGRGLGQDAVLALTHVVLLLPSLSIVIWFYRAYGETNLFLSPLQTNYLMLLLGAFAWPPIALVVRNAVATISQEEFVASARSLGSSGSQLMFRHILPNVSAAILSIAGVVFALNITAESLFAYLGLVNAQTDVVTWGFLLWEGNRLLIGYWWISFFPGLMIIITVLGFSLTADAVSDVLNPKLSN